MRKKIIFISPHLSTGGLPQYLLKKIQEFRNVADIYCVEYNYYGPDFVVQRDRISSLLGNNFFPLSDNKGKIIQIISDINPDIVHFEELCESFVSESILLEIFNPARKYSIFETCHSSNMQPSAKVFKPDKFIMVSPWIAQKFSCLNIPIEILEYPIEDFIPHKKRSQVLLGLDLDKKHILNIGLFTPGKNQKEIITAAEQLLEYPFVFHFVGNLAPNFKEYWAPLTSKLPSNCKIWGERNDVDLFYQASDLFLFTSTVELNPICIKEALSWKIPVLCKKLITYSDSYDTNQFLNFMNPEIDDLPQVLKKMLL